jgi:cyanophycin synthetase
VIDYGHNTSALKALIDALDRFPHHRRSCLYTAAGDRRDNDIIDQAQLLAMAFDELVIYEDQCTRGRADGEVIALMRQGLAKGARVQKIHETRGELIAMDLALTELRAGDLLLIQADQIDIAITFIKEWLATHNVPGLPAPRTPDRAAHNGARTAAPRPAPRAVGAGVALNSPFLGDGENDEDSCAEERACRAAVP